MKRLGAPSVFAAWLAPWLAACHPAPPPKPLAVAQVEALPAQQLDAIVEQGDATYALGTGAIRIVRGGVVVATAQAPDALAWTSAASIPALDGDGRWVVATRSDGALVRVTLGGEVEDIRARFGLGDARVQQIAAAGATVALALAGGVAVTTDGIHLARYAVAADRLAVSRDRLALAHADRLELWDLTHGARHTLAIAGAQPAFDGGGTLAIATDRGLWIERGGAFAPVPAPPGPVAIAASGARIWVRAGGALYVLDGAALLPTDAKLGARDTLRGSPTGDLWLATRGGDLRRLSTSPHHDDPVWRAQVEPVFARVCAHCHLPGGEAGIDLSTAALWSESRAEIARRVLVTRTMPPAGTDLSDTDRAALGAWLTPPR